MATILLSAAGQALGAAIAGPAGAMIGRALGATAGAFIDQALIRSTLPDLRGPRLADLDVQTSTEGRALPRVYGRARVTGQIVWATRYEETAKETSSGGKGGPTTTSYRYRANIAVAVCEGPVDRVGRIWADGVELDQSEFQIRIHLGGEDQPADPLLAARQPGGVPAYRGTVLVVFERLPLKDFGNRVPQFAFEVIRAVDRLEPMVRAVTLIPGTTEFGYGTAGYLRGLGPAGWGRENVHQTSGGTDLVAALDELQALCPNLERVALVVAWFGDDLRAGQCTLRPKVEAVDKSGTGTWSVAGLTRATAQQVSRTAGEASYGGTPSDETVKAAIAEIRGRGLQVVLYPFLMMDIPPGNGLPDPAGGAEQPAHPWRGRIGLHPAPGRPGTPDKTAAAAAQVAAFVGTAAPAQFAVSGGAVVYSGPAEWSFRRMILHYARLAQAAGGVDAVLIGSELRGLTTARSGPSAYPFVAALVALAADVKAILGPGTKVTYAADWSEWFGHRPADGSGDVHFHLDPLWASPNVDMIGIDAWWPLADWRHAGDHPDRAIADGPHDAAYLRARLAGGEGFDWYYPDAAARRAGARMPIADGAHGEPWVFRDKDLVAWWSHPHHDRPGGVRAATPTAWVPFSKPFWLTEAGCAAVDLGANQPNVFPDPKSSESGLPHFSRGGRDDLQLRRFAEAVLTRFDPAAAGFDPAWNPISPTTGARMVDPAGIHLWTWDARPFPAFPALGAVWRDAAHWATGHWLTGRLGGTSVEGLIRAILADAGFTAAEFRAVPGHVDGYVVDDRMAPRQALEPLLAAFQIDALDTGTAIRFAGRARRPDLTLTAADLVEKPGAPLVETRRAEEADLPASVAVTVSDALRDHRRTTVASRTLIGASRRETRADLALVMPVDAAQALAETWLRDVWSGRESLAFALGPERLAVEPGDILDLDLATGRRTVLVERIEDAGARLIEARAVDPDLYAPARTAGRAVHAAEPAAFGAPLVHVLDIAHPAGSDAPHRPFLAATVTPWPGPLAIWRAAGPSSFRAIGAVEAPATLGTLVEPLAPGPTGLIDRGPGLLVDLAGGTLVSLADSELFAGGNLAAVRSAAGLWEVLQFGTADLVAPDRWRLTRLLRAQGGSEDAWSAAIPAGSPFVLLDAAIVPLPTGPDDVGTTLDLRVGPDRLGYDDPAYRALAAAIGGRGLKPWSPVHLAGRRVAGGDVIFTWIRRSRLAGADAWTEGDVPLGEETERYRVEILSGATVVRRVETAAPAWTYPAADQSADFGTAQSTYTLRVAQLSATQGPGIARTATLAV